MPWLDTKDPGATKRLWESAISSTMQNVGRKQIEIYGGDGTLDVMACVASNSVVPPHKLSTCDLNPREIAFLLTNVGTDAVHFRAKVAANAPGVNKKLIHTEMISEKVPPALSIPLLKRLMKLKATVPKEYSARVVLDGTLKSIPIPSRLQLEIKGAAYSDEAPDDIKEFLSKWDELGLTAVQDRDWRLSLHLEADS
jgi:hypothetical protein